MNISLRKIKVLGKFPFVRLQQVIDNPNYLFHLIKKNLIYKWNSEKYIDRYNNIKIVSPSETLEIMMSNNVSLARFSDGEIEMLTGAGIYPPDSNWSQKWSKKLVKELKRVLSSTNNNLLVAVDPKETFLSPRDSKHDIPFEYNMWVDMRRILWRYLHETKTYGHCHLFISKNAPDFNWPKFRQYVSGYNVIVVTGNTSNIKHLKIGKTTKFIDVGTVNAYEKLNVIEDRIVDVINDSHIPRNEVIVFASLGPTACILAEKMLQEGVRVWDTGHMFEFAEQSQMEKLFDE